MKKWILVLLLIGGMFMHRTEGANAIIDSNDHQVFTGGPPPTAITAAWLNAVQEEICTVIENAGIQLKTQATDTRDQLWQALSNIGNPYDYVVTSNVSFDEALERVAANQYKFKDEYESIYFRSTEYSMAYVLDGGDTWGYIETNNIKHLHFEMGAYINMGNERGYIEVNTDGCKLQNVSIRGLGTVAAAIQQSFLLNADNVIFLNCNAKNRLSNGTMTGFKGSGTASHNQSSQYIGCLIEDMEAQGDFYGFNSCHNIANSRLIGITVPNIQFASAFYYCENISNSQAITFDGSCLGSYESNNLSNIIFKDFDGQTIVGMQNCNNIQNIQMEDLNATSGNCYGFDTCNNIDNVRIIQLDATANCYAFYQSNYISSCYVEDVDSSGGNSAGCYDCDNVSACTIKDIDAAVGGAVGLYDCDNASACSVTDVDGAVTYYGFDSCSNIVGCDVQFCEDGYNACSRISGSRATNNDNDGFMACTYISACISTTNGNDGYEDCTIISASAGNSNTGNGFDNCKNMTANRAALNTAANYVNSFADWAAANACADTAAGGYNS